MFLWCHVRHLNFTDKNPQRITKKDEGIAFLKIELQSKIGINVFCYENKVVYPVYLSDRNDIMDLLVILGHHVYIMTDLCLIKQNIGEKYFCKGCLQCFSSKNVLNEHKKRLFSYKWQTEC